jgi:monovalent cation:H+ antiporter, CPA1 family
MRHSLNLEVFTMEMAPYLILLFIGYLVYTLDYKKENLPVSPILVFIGLGLSFLPAYRDITITADFLYHALLPGLLFVSAYQFPIKYMKKYASVIAVLGTAGILATVILSGLAVYWIAQPFATITFIAAMLIAAILIPTDPVSVVQILSKDLNDELVTNVVEGESLLNDGTSIVVFTFLFTWYSTAPQGAVEGLSQFLYVSLGGIGIGAAGGWLFGRAVHFTHNRTYQIMLSIIVAYAVFLSAEAVHVSGVLASVFAGLMLSATFSKTDKESHFRESLDSFWEVVEVSILSLLFLLIGIVAAPYLFHQLWTAVIILFTAILLIRWFTVETMLRFIPFEHQSTFKERFLISISGVKGAISVYLLLKLETISGQEVDFISQISFSLIVLSLMLQSLAIHPIAMRMNKK